jgi:hypothetical protein
MLEIFGKTNTYTPAITTRTATIAIINLIFLEGVGIVGGTPDGGEGGTTRGWGNSEREGSINGAGS